MSADVFAVWPRDPANGRLLCSPENPMPKNAPGSWAHTSPKLVGECDEGCCSDYRCADCSAEWRTEYS